MDINVFNIEEISNLVHSLSFIGKKSSASDVAIVSFKGEYGDGSPGADDARYIKSITMSALLALDPCCIVPDLREMVYVWGDGLFGVFQDVSRFMDEEGEPGFPVIVIASDKCLQAILSLFGTSLIEAGKWLFLDYEKGLSEAVRAGKEWLNG